MRHHGHPRTTLVLSSLLATLALPASAATLVASYDFNNTLAANQGTAPALTAINPLGQNTFETALVNGQERTVYRWSGSGSSPGNNAGLKLDATGLVNVNDYSVAMTFEFTEAAQFGGGWRRIIDTRNRQSDSGFYVAPSNPLSLVEIGKNPQEIVGTTLFTTPGFHEVVLTVSPDGVHQQVDAYLDGRHEATMQTDFYVLENFDNPGSLLHFFVDNTVGGAEQEYANGRIASLRLYNGTFIPSAVPEPGVYAMTFAGLVVLAGWTRRRRAA